MAAHPDANEDTLIPAAIEENVWQVIEDLFMVSPASRQIANSGKAKVVGAIYNVGNGKVTWLPETRVREILKKAEADPNAAKEPMAATE